MADNYDVMTRVRDEGWLSYKINTVAEVRGSQSDEERRRRSDHVWERYIDFSSKCQVKWIMNNVINLFLEHFNTVMWKTLISFFDSCENDEIDVNVNCFSVTIF